MTEYRIYESRAFQGQLAALPTPVREALGKKLLEYVYPQLRDRPHFGPNVRKLKGWKRETWRYRIGPWRVFYCIDDGRKEVGMASLSRRDIAYR